MRKELLNKIVEVVKADAFDMLQEFWFSTYSYDMNNVEYPEEPSLLFEEGDVQVIIEPEFCTLYITHLTQQEYEELKTLFLKEIM
jgi:hypothetical protein